MVAVQKTDKKFKERFNRSANRCFVNSRPSGHQFQRRVNPGPQRNGYHNEIHGIQQQIDYRVQQQKGQYHGNWDSNMQRYPFNAIQMIPSQVLGAMVQRFPNAFIQVPFIQQPVNTSSWMRQNTPPRQVPEPFSPETAPKMKAPQSNSKNIPPERAKTPPLPVPNSPSVRTSHSRENSTVKRKSPSPIKKPPTPTLNKQRNVAGSQPPGFQSPTNQDILDEFADMWTPVKETTKASRPPGYNESPPINEIKFCEPAVSMQSDSEDELIAKVNQSILRLENLNLSSLSTRALVSSDANSFPECDEVVPEATGGSDPALPDWVYHTVQMVPKDMATYKDDIAVNHTQNVLTIDGWTEIAVSDMHNPHKFFFQTKEDIRQIEELMEQLEKFYERDSSAKLTPKVHELRPKLIVAALYTGLWHRGRIISEPFQLEKRTMCRVYYVDYGTVNTVPVEDIRFLHKDFLEKPQLCHRASLSGILPYGDTWNCEISRIFLAHVMDRELYAMAHKYYAPDRSWHVELVDPKTKPHDLEDYMEFYRSHAPTFDELISGQYPTYSELLEYHRLGIEYEPKIDNTSEEINFDDTEDTRTEEEERTLYLNENNPFIGSLREKNIRVIVRPAYDMTASSSPVENFFSNCAKKDIPLDNLNIPFDQKILTRRPNPFSITFSDD
uniref:Tudor domain-containing protein n=1 Tax=Lutzomyia longipalpis TaxID=7200 RepID=A0A1B0GK58_LUTLO